MNKRVVSSCLLVLFCSLALPATAQTPSAVCTSQLTPLSIEIGRGIPLPRAYENPTDRSVTFILTMQTNSLFGPAHEVSRVTLPAKTGKITPARIHPTGLRTPVGSAHVVINVTTDRTGARVVGRCDYQLRLKAPPGVPSKIPGAPLTPQSLSWLFQIPVRICVLEGSTLADGKTPGDTIGGRQARQLRDLLESVNQDIWFPHAQIAFSSSIEIGFPVVADPSRFKTSCGAIGDLEVAGFAFGDALFAEDNCVAAWQQKYPGRPGIPIVLARSFCNSGLTLGGAAPPGTELFVKGASPLSGQRGDDLCGSPQRLTSVDITNQFRRPFVVLVEPANNGGARNGLAHELGHNLFLGHGNGLDDDHDGRPAGRRGPRRYDEYCDPKGLAEDALTEFVDCARTGSLMRVSGSCADLRPFQVETARSVARLIPGFVDTSPPEVFEK